tara:strand:+ start:35 stop:301 length:267 start_codon:yes stop_codon:yes gene_type:complete
MAITKSTTVHRIEIKPAKNSGAVATDNAKHPTIMIVYNDKFADDGDSSSTISQRVVNMSKFSEDGGNPTDYSKEDVLVKLILDEIWKA